MPRIMHDHERPLVAPDIAVELWPDAPWWQPVDQLAVDKDRTAGLVALDQRVRTSGHTPLQAAGPSRRQVISFKGWVPTGSHLVPLPEDVWLLRNGDDQWFGFDLDRGNYWECGALGPTVFPWWRADHVARFDLSLPWNQRNGLAGGGIPIWALIARVGALRAGSGGVEHGLNLSVSGNYAKASVSWLRKTDGTLSPSSHPLRAGECLRLTAEAYARLSAAATTPEQLAALWAMRYRGVYVNDKTDPRAGHAIRFPYGVTPGLALVLARDFEVVVAR
jgi:hypothetical protein